MTDKCNEIEILRSVLYYFTGIRGDSVVSPGGRDWQARELMIKAFTCRPARELPLSVIGWLIDVAGSENEGPGIVVDAILALTNAWNNDNENAFLLYDDIIEAAKEAKKNHPMPLVTEPADKLMQTIYSDFKNASE